MNPHMEEWKDIRKSYLEQEQTDEIKFRIECIDDLIKSTEEKELNHFK